MRKIVFFQTPHGPVPAEEFILTQAPALQETLTTMAERLAAHNMIEGPRVYRHGTGKWSVWLEDRDGNRHNFVLYTSGLDRPGDPSPQPAKGSGSKFFISVPSKTDRRPGETDRVEGSVYITENFSGLARTQLLEALAQAEKGMPGYDGSIEWTDNGVILRALKDEQNNQLFHAEVRLRR